MAGIKRKVPSTIKRNAAAMKKTGANLTKLYGKDKKKKTKMPGGKRAPKKSR